MSSFWDVYDATAPTEYPFSATDELTIEKSIQTSVLPKKNEIRQGKVTDLVEISKSGYDLVDLLLDKIQIKDWLQF